MTYIEFYEATYDFLIEHKPLELSKEDIDDFITNQSVKLDSLNDVFRIMVGSLQDYNRMPNIIKYYERKEDFKEILFDYNYIEVLKNYTEESLLEEFKKRYSINNVESKSNSFRRYSKSLLSASKFLSTFEDINEFKKFIDGFTMNELTAYALPLLLSSEIYGLGFALACNLLKDLGYMNYPKPDIHLKDVLSAIGFCKNDDVDCFKTVIKIANECNVTAYKIDKLVWVICSGNYHNHNIKVKGLKHELISYLKSFISK